MADNAPVPHTLRWQGIEIEIVYHPCWADLPDGPLAHVAIEAVNPPRACLPITETGYLSHFFPRKEIGDSADIAELIREWLDERAKSKEWQTYLEKSRQLELF